MRALYAIEVKSTMWKNVITDKDIRAIPTIIYISTVQMQSFSFTENPFNSSLSQCNNSGGHDKNQLFLHFQNNNIDTLTVEKREREWILWIKCVFIHLAFKSYNAFQLIILAIPVLSLHSWFKRLKYLHFTTSVNLHVFFLAKI